MVSVSGRSEIDFPDPLNATTRRRSVHRFADQSVAYLLALRFLQAQGVFFKLTHHRDHAQIEARGGFAGDFLVTIFSPLFNSLRI